MQELRLNMQASSHNFLQARWGRRVEDACIWNTVQSNHFDVLAGPVGSTLP